MSTLTPAPMPQVDDDVWAVLRGVARRARARAYVPYSHYAVGAAVLTRDLRVFAGANVENVALTPTIHAEQAAILAALGDGVIGRLGRVWIAAVAVDVAGPAAAPCGVCRQTLAEFADDATCWRSDGDDGSVIAGTLADLLPHAFGPGAF